MYYSYKKLQIYMIVQNCTNQDWTRKLLFHIAVSCRRRFRHFNSFHDHHCLANIFRCVTVIQIK